jgi:hypothetical protein
MEISTAGPAAAADIPIITNIPAPIMAPRFMKTASESFRVLENEDANI